VVSVIPSPNPREDVYNSPRGKTMPDVKEAVKVATEYIQTLFTEKQIPDLRLEEVELSPDGKFWDVTLSFVSRESSPYLSLGEAAKTREYKVFRVNAETAQVQSMKIRRF